MTQNIKASVTLRSTDIRQIEKMLHKGKHPVRVIKRGQIMLALHRKQPAKRIAAIVRTTPRTVYNTLQAYREAGLACALHDLPRPGRKPALNQQQDARIVALACSNPPVGRARWTVRLLVVAAKKMKIVMTVGRETIRNLLENHAIKPWREKMWCVADLDKEYIEKMEDVLGLYEKPYNPRHPVVCLDEKPVQLLSEPYKTISAKKGQIKRRDHEYKREGVANVFCGVEPKTGKVIVKPTQNRTALAFAKFFRAVIRKYKKAVKVHIVLDNLNTHKEKSLIDAYGVKLGTKLWKRAVVHYTPKHASWLNQAEIAIGIFSRQCLGKDRVDSLSTLRKRTRQWIKRGEKILINWRFTRKKAKEKFKYGSVKTKRSRH
jgi:transposase